MNNTEYFARRCSSWNIVVASSIALLVALMLVVIMHHPVARHTDAAELVTDIARQASSDRLVHGTLAVALTAMTSLMLGFAARLGLARPHVMLGAVSTALALVLICLAVLLDGFVAPAIAVRCITVGGNCAGEAQALLRFGGLQIEFMTRFGLYALTGATALWASDLIIRNDRAWLPGLLGLASAALQLGVLVLGGSRLGVHNLTLFVGAQALWYLSVGAVILFRPGPYADNQVA